MLRQHFCWVELLGCIFSGAEPGYGLPDFGILDFVQFAVCAVGICAGAGYAQPGGGSVTAAQISFCSPVRCLLRVDSVLVVSGHVCRLCAALPGGCGHLDPGLRALGGSSASLASNLAALLCYFLLGCAALAVGEFCSSLTENQDVLQWSAALAFCLLAYLMPGLRSMFSAGSAAALVVLCGAGGALFSLGVGLPSKSLLAGCIGFAVLCLGLSALFWFRSAWLIEAFSAVLEALCLFVPFESFVNGVFSVPSVVYYLTVSALFLFFSSGAGAGPAPLELREEASVYEKTTSAQKGRGQLQPGAALALAVPINWWCGVLS